MNQRSNVFRGPVFPLVHFEVQGKATVYGESLKKLSTIANEEM